MIMCSLSGGGKAAADSSITPMLLSGTYHREPSVMSRGGLWMAVEGHCRRRLRRLHDEVEEPPYQCI